MWFAMLLALEPTVVFLGPAITGDGDQVQATLCRSAIFNLKFKNNESDDTPTLALI